MLMAFPAHPRPALTERMDGLTKHMQAEMPACLGLPSPEPRTAVLEAPSAASGAIHKETAPGIAGAVAPALARRE